MDMASRQCCTLWDFETGFYVRLFLLHSAARYVALPVSGLVTIAGPPDVLNSRITS